VGNTEDRVVQQDVSAQHWVPNTFQVDIVGISAAGWCPGKRDPITLHRIEAMVCSLQLSCKKPTPNYI
jgi:hypothetical protein